MELLYFGKDHQDRWQLYSHFFIFHFLILPYMTNSTTQTSIVPQDTTSQISLKPIQSVEAIVDAYHEYNKLKQMLLTDSDYQTIK